jgi:putative DNA methylase
MIEADFDVAFVADLALREKQIQQNYRPIIAVHKWFARRPGTLFRALLLSEFTKGPLRETFYASNKLNGIRVADPFMGGGTPLLEANRLGCDVVGYDINPMSYWIVRQEIEHLDLKAYRKAGDVHRRNLFNKIGHLYRTRCQKCGDDADVKYFLWVKVVACKGCNRDIDLFPGYLLSEDVRHPLNVIVCSQCGELNERENVKSPGNCDCCAMPLTLKGPAFRSQVSCPHCRVINKYPDTSAGAPRHRMFALEYQCTKCKPTHTGRFFKKSDASDHARVTEAEATVAKLKYKFVPIDEIPAGDETDRLHRWGYTHYHQMFNARQLLGLESSCRLIAAQKDDRLRHALSTNLSDLLRYQNMLCRYDTMALKSLDIFSVHGFPVGLIQCESNLLGIVGPSGASVGSGGWSNIIDKFEKAKAYCDDPFEVRHEHDKKIKVPIQGEWIGDHRDGMIPPETRDVVIRCADASKADIAPASLDAVLTDPPYYGSVQYAELMDFCYVWLRRLLPPTDEAFKAVTTRHISELTQNNNMKRGIESFAEGLSAVLCKMAQALKPGGPLVFTYHHNKLQAYVPVAVAILDAGMFVSAAIPCPAEMEASIHINGTGSSIIDTVFVCRAIANHSSQPSKVVSGDIANAVLTDMRKLREGGVEATDGDVRSLIHGHITRVAVENFRVHWDRSKPFTGKVIAVTHFMNDVKLDAIHTHLLESQPKRVNTKVAKGLRQKTKGAKYGSVSV